MIRCGAVILLFSLVASTVDAGWIDPDTPEAGLTTSALTIGDDREYQIVRILLNPVLLADRAQISHGAFLIVCRFFPMNSTKRVGSFTTAQIRGGQQ